MCKPVKCPQCGHEFTPERDKPRSGAWTPEEDELLLRGYQKERKTIADLAEELDRSQDATRNRLYVLRGAGKAKGVTAAVSLSAKEFDEMRAARTEVKNARKVVECQSGCRAGRDLRAIVEFAVLEDVACGHIVRCEHCAVLEDDLWHGTTFD